MFFRMKKGKFDVLNLSGLNLKRNLWQHQNIVVIKDNDEYSLQMKEYESMLQRQLEIQELNEKYHVTVNPSKKMVQYSQDFNYYNNCICYCQHIFFILY